MVYLVRHAAAGERKAWHGDDQRRPLSARGRRQAAALPARLNLGAGTGRHRLRIASSVALRCVETVTPLAEALGAELAVDDRLLEGSTASVALACLEQLEDGGIAVACSHGDVIEAVIEMLHIEPPNFRARCQKSGTWVLERVGRHLVPMRYIPPPSTDESAAETLGPEETR